MNETKQPSSTEQKDKAIFKRTYQEHGQAMVETAFVMIILLLLLSVIIDLGRAFFTYLALQNAAGEGAYYAAKDPTSVDNTDNPDPDNIIFRVKHESPDSSFIAGSPLLNWDTEEVEVTVTFLCPNGDPRNKFTVSSGTFAVVSVEYSFETIGPIGGMLPIAYRLAANFANMSNRILYLQAAEYWEDWDGTFPIRAETKQFVLEDPGAGSLGCN